MATATQTRVGGGAAAAAAAAAGAPPAVDAARESLLNRLLPPELPALIEDHRIENHYSSDLSDADVFVRGIDTWYKTARRSLRECTKEEIPTVERRCHYFLKLLLVDAFTLGHLDEQAVLGSDGHTYAGQTLIDFARTAPEALRRRSPMNPDDPRELTTKIHPVARFMVRWLKTKDADFRAGRVGTAERVERVRRAAQARRERERAGRAARVGPRVAAFRAAAGARAEEATRRANAAFARVNATVNEARERQTAAAAGQNARVDELERTVEEVRDELPGLRARADDVEARIARVEAQTAVIDQKVKDTQAAIDEAGEDDPWGDVLKVVLVIAVCAAGSYAAYAAWSAAGGGAAAGAGGLAAGGAGATAGSATAGTVTGYMTVIPAGSSGGSGALGLGFSIAL